MRYLLRGTSILQTGENSGVIQNAGQYNIELSSNENFTDSFVLRTGDEVSFNKKLFIRICDCNEKSPLAVANVVTFISLGGTTSTNTADEMLDSIFGGAVSDESVTSDADADSYFDDIFSGNSSSNVDDEDFNSYMDSIFGGNG